REEEPGADQQQRPRGEEGERRRRKPRAENRAQRSTARDETEEALALRDGEELAGEHPELQSEERTEQGAPAVEHEQERLGQALEVEERRAVRADDEREQE